MDEFRSVHAQLADHKRLIEDQSRLIDTLNKQLEEQRVLNDYFSKEIVAYNARRERKRAAAAGPS
jgi:hypothetical protein